MVRYVKAQMLWNYIIRTWDSKSSGYGTAMDSAKSLADEAFHDLLVIAYPSAHKKG